MPVCPNCAADVDIDQNFCADCGADLSMRADGNTATVDTARPGGNQTAPPEAGSEAASASASELTDITLPMALGWGVGVLLIMVSVGGLVQGAGVAPVILYLLAGVLSIPPTRKRIEAEAGISLSRWMIVVLVAALFAAAGSLAAT